MSPTVLGNDWYALQIGISKELSDVLDRSRETVGSYSSS